MCVCGLEVKNKVNMWSDEGFYIGEEVSEYWPLDWRLGWMDG